MRNAYEIIYFQPSYRLVGVSNVLYNWNHSKVLFEYFSKMFKNRERKGGEKKSSLTGFFNDTCLAPALNVFDKKNNLNQKRNSQVSL